MNKDIFSNAIIPSIEIGSYEAMWLDHITTFKQMADRFVNSELHRGSSLPSDFVNNEQLAKEYYAKILQIIKQNELDEYFGAIFRNTFDYPKKLNDAKYPVELLYYAGDIRLLHMRSIAIVGTRNPSEFGKKIAKDLVRYLVHKKIVIVSGFASGIDTCVHESAIEFGGDTVAVLGTPIGVVYPKQNNSLFRKLVTKHLVVSQVPFIKYQQETQKTTRFYFPERNKTMSALTEATIIVEASDTSGTLIQARAAIEQGRKLFILANCFNQGLSWPEKYIAKGAIKVNNFDDIFNALDC